MIRILRRIVKFILQGAMWSTLWVFVLTPYSIIVEELTLQQFLYWLLMEYTIVLPISPIVYWIGEQIMKKASKIQLEKVFGGRHR